MKKIILIFLVFISSCSQAPQPFTLIDHDTPCALMLDLGPFSSALQACNAFFDTSSLLPDSLMEFSRRALCVLELRNHLARTVEMRESRIPIFDNDDPIPEGVIIHIGLPSDRKEFKAIRRSVEKRWDDTKSNQQTFRMDSFTHEKQTILVLSGKNSIGELYAGYELLQMIGVRWFYPGEEGTVIHPQYEIKLPGLKTAKSPVFEYRGYQKWDTVELDADSEFCMWMIRNRLNVFPGQKKYHRMLQGGGVFTAASSRPVYQYSKSGMIDAKGPDGFCMHSENWKTGFTDLEFNAISIWPPEIWCQCPKCSALSNTRKYAQIIDTIENLVNSSKHVPRHLFVNFPVEYGEFDVFEKNIPSENTTLLLYAGPRCYNHYSIDPNCVNINYPFADISMNYLKKTERKMGITELFNDEYMGELITAFPSVMRLDVPAYHELGAHALLYMNPKISNAGIQQLVHYQFAHQTWNPAISIDSLNTEYFIHCYGPIAPLMKQFYLYMEASLQSVTTWLYYLPIQLEQGLNQRDTTIIRNEKYQPAEGNDINFNKVWEKSYYNIYEARFLLNKAIENELPDAMKSRLKLHEKHLLHAELVMNMMDGIILYTTLGRNEPEMRQEALTQVVQYAEQLRQYSIDHPMFGTENAFYALNLNDLVVHLTDIMESK